jgi:hypothetical protein
MRLFPSNKADGTKIVISVIPIHTV